MPTPSRSRAFRALTLLAAAGLTAAWPVRAQPPQPEPGLSPAKAEGGALKKVDLAPNEDDFLVWRRKAGLELESLLAQVEAKKAAIRMREAEFRLGQLAPTLAILGKLEERVSMNFANETPLGDVLKYVKSATQGPDDHGIPIYVDPKALQLVEKTMASTVSIDVEGVPLSVTLRLVLKQLGLDYQVQHGLLTVTVRP